MTLVIVRMERSGDGHLVVSFDTVTDTSGRQKVCAQYLLNLAFCSFQVVLYKLGSMYLAGFLIIPCLLMSDCSILVRNYTVSKCEQTDDITIIPVRAQRRLRAWFTLATFKMAEHSF